MSRRAERWSVLGVLALSAGFRVWGIQFGLPHPMCRPDEETVIAKALGFFSGDFNPHFFMWPSLYFYVIHAGLRVVYIAGHMTGRYPDIATFVRSASMAPSWMYLVDRFVSATCGVLTVAVVYGLTKRLFDRSTALIASVFIAVAFLHVRDSHFGTLDVTMTLCVLLSMRCLAEVWRRDDVLVWWAFAGVSAGLAASLKYNAGALLAVGVVAATLRFVERPQTRPRAWIGFSVFGLAFAAAFVLGTPYAVLDPLMFQRDVLQQASYFQGGQGDVRVINAWLHHLTFSLGEGLGLPLLCAGLAGMAMLAVVDWRKALFILTFPVLFFAVMGSGATAFVRYAVPLVPFLCVAAAFALTFTAAALRSPVVRRVATSAAVFVVVAPSIVRDVQFDRLLTMRDNRLVVADWLATHMAYGESLYETGAIYTHPDLAWGFDTHAAMRVLFSDGSEPEFATSPDPAAAPDWIVVAESPIHMYARVSSNLHWLLGRRYDLVQGFAATHDREEDIWFDRQDAFFLPLANFKSRDRPGPDFLVYRRRR